MAGVGKSLQVDAKQSEIRGGLNFHDIFSSWSAFKFSWFRRIAKSDNSWKEIFVQNLSTLIVDLNFFFTDPGAIEYTRIANKFPNSYWSDCLNVIKCLLAGAY